MRVRPEDKLQIAVIEYLRLCFPQCVAFAIPNEGNRSALGHKIAVAKGLLPGIHDICVLVPIIDQRSMMPDRFMWEPHFIELKTPNGRVSEAQAALHADFDAKRIKQAVCHSVDEVVLAMAQWGITSANKRDQALADNFIAEEGRLVSPV